VKIRHHDLVTDLDDEWWAEAGMEGFVPTRQSYRTDQDATEVSIVDIGPVGTVRQLHRIFRESPDGVPARDRALKILQGFRRGEAIPPVEVTEGDEGYGHKFKLTNGTHRLYLSIAAGFTHVPTIKGFTH
jgi:hypothetical protein